MYRSVDIGKRIKGEELEKILLEVAEEMGLRAESVDEFKTRYRLGSVREEQSYEGTEVRLSGRLLPLMGVTGIKKGEERDWFAITTGFHMAPRYGFGSKKQIKKYLSAVSERLLA